MPVVGEIKRGNEIGYKHNVKHVWHACECCGKERWVIYTRGLPQTKLCYDCAVHSDEFRQKQYASHKGQHISLEARKKMSESKKGAKHPLWKGGRIGDGHGYIQVLLLSTDPYFAMATKMGYVKEHRLVMAKHLGRCLEADELVHHLNGIREDNRLVNLACVKKGSHSHRTFILILQQYIRKLENQLAKTKMIWD